MIEFCLENAEEVLDDGIVETIPLSRHALIDTAFPELGDESAILVLETLIGMKDMGAGLPLLQGLFERLHHERDTRSEACGVADNLPTVKIEDGR